MPDSAWRDLPPLRPSAPAIELTAPVQRLAATMTSTQRTGVTHDELGHARTADGPAGTVVGLLTPRGAMHRERAEGEALVYAAAAPEPVAGTSAVPLRRGSTRPTTTPNHGQLPDAQPVGADARTPDVPPVPAPSAPASRPTVTSSPSSAPSPAPSLRDISGPQRIPVASSDLPAIAARPLHARERPRPVTPPHDPVSMPVAVPDRAPSQAPSTPTNLSTISGTAATIPSVIASTLSPPTSGSSLSTEPPPSIERSPLVGRTRIVRRIGEPLRERPASMVPTADAPMSTRAQPHPASQPGIARLPQSASAGPRPSLPAPGAVPDRAARPVTSIDATSSGPSSTVGFDGGASGRPQPGPARPLVGSRPSIQRLAEAPTGNQLISKLTGKPLATGLANDPEPAPVRWGPIAQPGVQPGVQRAPEGVPADLRAELEPVLGTPLADVKVHRDNETGEAARQLSAKAFTAGGEVFLPDWHGSTTGGEARSILTHELTHVAQQRRLGSALPDEASSEGTALESEARAVARQGPPVAVRPVAPSRAANAPQRLAGEAPSPPARALAARSGGGMTPSDVAAQVQAAASAAGLAPAPPAVEVHRPDEPGSSPTVAPPATGSPGGGGPSVVQRLSDQGDLGPAMTTSVSTPETPTDGPAQLDELARRLYPRFRTRLRQDLLADRERSGRLFDVR